MTIPFVDCQGLAGAYTLGVIQTDKFHLTHRVSLPGGFGDQCIDANRTLVGDGWEQETPPEREWTPQDGVGFLAGTPPCSGFSLLNTSKGPNGRGSGSAINSCMKELVAYAGKCTGTDGKPGPEVISLESVQGAFSQGRDLMQELRADVEFATGQRYDLHHVLMSGSSVGAAQMRHRYYLILSRVPFGTEEPEERVVVNYEQAIGDLVGADLTWDDQPIPGEPSEWATAKVRPDGLVSGHVTVAETNRMPAIIREACERGWQPGYNLGEAMTALDYHPEAFANRIEPDGSYRGWSWPTRINKDRPGYVLTGGGIHAFIHWSEPRQLTARECARLMGYPDAWTFPAKSPMQASMWIGKCCPVDSGRWIADWVGRAIEGNPGTFAEEIGDREFKCNYTNLYKQWPGGNVPKRGALEGSIS